MTALAGMAYLAGGSTTSRGPYAEQVRKAVSFILGSAQANGLLAYGEENGRPMYGHGFGLLFLATAYGMETDATVRERITTGAGIASMLRARGMPRAEPPRYIAEMLFSPASICSAYSMH